MKENARERPRIVVSACLVAGGYRYDGATKTNEFVSLLSEYVDCILVCPEMAIGLGVPRSRIRLIEKTDGVHVIQDITHDDLTQRLGDFARIFIPDAGAVDGWILKAKSPSCGLGDTKVFNEELQLLHKQGTGVFASVVKEMCADSAVVSDKQLADDVVRQRFLDAVFGCTDCPDVLRDYQEK